MKSLFCLVLILSSATLMAAPCSSELGFAGTIQKNKEKIATKYMTAKMKVEEKMVTEVVVTNMNEGARVLSNLVNRVFVPVCPEIKHSGNARLEVGYLKPDGQRCKVSLSVEGTIPVLANRMENNQFSLNVKPVSRPVCE